MQVETATDYLSYLKERQKLSEQEKIHEARRAIRVGWMTFIIGVAIVIMGVIAYIWHVTAGLPLALVGIAFGSIGVFEVLHYTNKIEKSMKELTNGDNK